MSATGFPAGLMQSHPVTKYSIALASTTWRWLVNFGSQPWKRHLPTQVVPMSTQTHCIRNQQGLITQLRDAEGRQWCFEYANGRLAALTNPLGHKWLRRGGNWVPCDGTNDFLLQAEVDQRTAEVTLQDNLRRCTYKIDGTTIFTIEHEASGAKVRRTTYTELPTRPRRAFVVRQVEDDRETITWIQDANGKLYKFEYDDCGRLARYLQLSAQPALVWSAEYDATGQLNCWHGSTRRDQQDIGIMDPMLMSVDLSGNRNFRRSNGYRFTVLPDGSAIAADCPEAAQFSSTIPSTCLSQGSSL
jgi:YD repeat-containing protein